MISARRVATISAPNSVNAFAHLRAPSFYRLLNDWIFLQQPLESSV
jgi:hypothetical protein